MKIERLDSYELTGRTALITGAAGLLGPQHAAALLAAGARVVLTDINTKALDKTASDLRKHFGEHMVLDVAMDVTDEARISMVCSELAEDLRITVLINNAAVNPPVNDDIGKQFTRLEHFSLRDWNDHIAVGLTGAFLTAKVFGTRMAKEGRGVILNIASDLSVIAPDQRIYRSEGVPEELQPVKPVSYSVVKAGLIGLTRYLASYWADRGVRVNALSPGGVFNDQPAEFVKKLTDLIPMRRMANVDEYRAAVLFMCSDASSYMTGQNVILDGGRSIV